MLQALRNDLQKAANPAKAKILQGFFKTGKGEYGEGDIFLGIVVPESRKIARKYPVLSLADITLLLKSKIHEERLIALLLLVEKFDKAEGKEQDELIEYYLSSTRFINNWDLVDLSAPQLLGAYLLAHPEKKPVLKKLASSRLLWEKRIAIVATQAFIRKNQFQDTLQIAELLLEDTHDLIHKAVGWMLREVGKRDQAVEEIFLEKYYQKMPRTMLRYAIERFDEEKKRYYMRK